jgi:hypothetical protein
VRISHLTVANSDDRPDVSTRQPVRQPRMNSTLCPYVEGRAKTLRREVECGVKGRDRNLP